MRTKCDTAVCSHAKMRAEMRRWSERRAVWETVVLTFKVLTGGCFSFCPECIFPDRLCESDSVRINLRRCSSSEQATSLSQWLTEPVTFGWVRDYWCFICAAVAHLRLLRLSYVKMRDCQEKPQGCDNNLSISPFFLPLPLSFYFNLSACLSSPPLWLFILSFCLTVPASLSPISSCSFHHPYFPLPPSLILSLPFPSYLYFLLFLFSLAHNLLFWCRLTGFMVSPDYML